MRVLNRPASGNGSTSEKNRTTTTNPAAVIVAEDTHELMDRLTAVAMANADATDRLLEHTARALDLSNDQLKAINRMLEVLKEVRQEAKAKGGVAGAGSVNVEDCCVCRYTTQQVATIIGDGTNARAVGKFAAAIKVHADAKMLDPATGLFSMAAVTAIRAERDKRKRINPSNFKKSAKE